MRKDYVYWYLEYTIRYTIHSRVAMGNIVVLYIVYGRRRRESLDSISPVYRHRIGLLQMAGVERLCQIFATKEDLVAPPMVIRVVRQKILVENTSGRWK